MQRRNVVRGEGTTRQTILAAATERFASASYDDVSLRDLAADVGVDVAYVHRSFGSKERLFREVLELRRVDSQFLNVGIDTLAMYLARGVIERPHIKGHQQTDPLMILIYSLTSTKAGAIVGEWLQTDFIEPLRRKIGDSTPSRASMIMSLLIGFSILRNLLKLSAPTEIDSAQAEMLIAHAIEGIMSSDSRDEV